MWIVICRFCLWLWRRWWCMLWMLNARFERCHDFDFILRPLRVCVSFQFTCNSDLPTKHFFSDKYYFDYCIVFLGLTQQPMNDIATTKDMQWIDTYFGLNVNSRDVPERANFNIKRRKFIVYFEMFTNCSEWVEVNRKWISSIDFGLVNKSNLPDISAHIDHNKSINIMIWYAIYAQTLIFSICRAERALSERAVFVVLKSNIDASGWSAAPHVDISFALHARKHKQSKYIVEKNFFFVFVFELSHRRFSLSWASKRRATQMIGSTQLNCKQIESED